MINSYFNYAMVGIGLIAFGVAFIMVIIGMQNKSMQIIRVIGIIMIVLGLVTACNL